MLNTNQNGISLNQLGLQQKLEDRRVFEQFLNKTEHVTCDKPKGHLVKENIVQQFGATFTDTAKDVRNLGKALTTGQSNDHELGRMNDIGMKIGGGLIAAALMGSKATSNKKLMEIFGFGTFFSVMSLWPKVAIDLPTKLMHGFNPHQKYVDSQGRKKQFFQDNQYLPWDVWTKDEINKVADKMNVPKDLKDREEFTKEKMRTIALQDNTLWMLTAGLATPLMTSLACNRIEEGLRVPVANFGLKNIAKQIEDPSKLIGKTLQNQTVFGKQDEAFKKITAALRNGEMPENLDESLSKIFDITSVMDNRAVSDKVVKKNLSYSRELISKLFPAADNFADSRFVTALVGEEGDEALAEAKELFSKAYKNVSAANGEGSSINIAQIIDNINEMIDGNPEKYQGRKWVDKIQDGLEGLPSDLKTLAKTKAGYDRETLSQGADTLEKLYTESIKPVQAQMNLFGRQVKKLDGISGEKYNRAARAMVEAFGFTDKEIRILRNSNEAFGGDLQAMIAKKLSEIASDDKRYAEVCEKLLKEQQKIEEAALKDKSKISIKSVFEKLTGKISEAMKGAGKNFGDETLQNSGFAQMLSKGLTEDEIAYARSNITSVDSMISRICKALDLERKIADGSLIKDWAKYAESNNYKGNLQSLTADELEDFYQVCRKVVWQSSYGDAMNKFHVTGNGAYFKTLSDTLFDGTVERDWCQAAKSIANETDYIPNPSLKIGLNHADCTSAYINETAKSHGRKFADYGESVLNTFKKQINQMYNDKTWMKTFGGITLALVGITFVSQLFFGRVKDAHLYQKAEPQNPQDTFESGK